MVSNTLKLELYDILWKGEKDFFLFRLSHLSTDTQKKRSICDAEWIYINNRIHMNHRGFYPEARNHQDLAIVYVLEEDIF